MVNCVWLNVGEWEQRRLELFERENKDHERVEDRAMKNKETKIEIRVIT